MASPLRAHVFHYGLLIILIFSAVVRADLKWDKCKLLFVFLPSPLVDPQYATPVTGRLSSRELKKKAAKYSEVWEDLLTNPPADWWSYEEGAEDKLRGAGYGKEDHVCTDDGTALSVYMYLDRSVLPEDLSQVTPEKLAGATIYIGRADVTSKCLERPFEHVPSALKELAKSSADPDVTSKTNAAFAGGAQGAWIANVWRKKRDVLLVILRNVRPNVVLAIELENDLIAVYTRSLDKKPWTFGVMTSRKIPSIAEQLANKMINHPRSWSDSREPDGTKARDVQKLGAKFHYRISLLMANQWLEWSTAAVKTRAMVWRASGLRTESISLADALEIFNRVDANHNGYLSAAEMAGPLRAPRSDGAVAVGWFDTDGDNQLDFMEYLPSTGLLEQLHPENRDLYWQRRENGTASGVNLRRKFSLSPTNSPVRTPATNLTRGRLGEMLLSTLRQDATDEQKPSKESTSSDGQQPITTATAQQPSRPEQSLPLPALGATTVMFDFAPMVTSLGLQGTPNGGGANSAEKGHDGGDNHGSGGEKGHDGGGIYGSGGGYGAEKGHDGGDNHGSGGEKGHDGGGIYGSGGGYGAEKGHDGGDNHGSGGGYGGK